MLSCANQSNEFFLQWSGRHIVYFISFSLLVVRFMFDNHCADSICNVRHEWLLDDNTKNWVTKDLKVSTDCFKI